MTAKPKSELMARLRAERKEAGLVRLDMWVTPEQRADVIKFIASKKPAT